MRERRTSVEEAIHRLREAERVGDSVTPMVRLYNRLRRALSVSPRRVRRPCNPEES